MKFKKISSLAMLSLIFILPALNSITQISPSTEFFEPVSILPDERSIHNPLLKSAASAYPWWNDTYEYRIPVVLNPNGVSHDNAPIEFRIDFASILDASGNPISDEHVNTTNIQVIEQTTSGGFTQYVNQYDPLPLSYGDEGEIAWIVDQTGFSTNKTFFIYFCLGDTDKYGGPVYDSPYSRSLSDDPIRLFHNGFEEGTVAPLDPFMTYSTDYGASTVILNDYTTGIQGEGALEIQGDIWAMQALPASIDTTDPTYSNLFLTYQVQAYGLINKFDYMAMGVAASENDFYWRGYQHWGEGSHVNLYSDSISSANVWNYFAMDLQATVDYPDGLVNYVLFILEDSDIKRNDDNRFYFDDISIWNQEVGQHQTTDVEVDIQALEIPFASINLLVLDSDGNALPNANVEMKKSGEEIYYYGTTDENGQISFTDIDSSQDYDFTLNYSTQGIETAEIFNIASESFNSDLQDITIFADIWTMNYSVTDYDGDIFNDGYVVLYNNTAAQEPVGNVTLDSSGNSIIRYSNKTDSYNYSVFYDTNLFDQGTYATNQLEIASDLISSTQNELVSANISTLTFNVSGYTSTDTSSLGYASLEITNGTYGDSIANITTDSAGFVDFMYFRSNNSVLNNYTMHLKFLGGNQSINATDTPQRSPKLGGEWQDYLNFSLDTKMTKDILVDFLDDVEYSTNITAVSFTSGANFNPDWGELLEFQVNYTSYDGDSVTLTDPDTIEYEMYDTALNLVKSGTLVKHLEGIYNLTLDSSEFIAGFTYRLDFMAYKSGYPSPTNTPNAIIKIEKLGTTFEIYDASTGLAIDGQTINKIWGEIFDVEVVYKLQSPEEELSGATAILDWDYDVEASMVEQNYAGFTNYTYSVNTSKSPTTGLFDFDLTADLLNHTSLASWFRLEILEIPTAINRDAYTDPITLYWEENFTMSLNYTDTFNNVGIEEAYLYYNIVGDPDFNEYPIPETGTSGIYEITLNSTSFDEAGTYTFQIVGQKTNYENQQLWISAVINIVPTILTAESIELTPYWNQNFTLSLNSTDTYFNRAINDSSITYSVSGPASFSESGEINFVGNGIYEKEFNTTHFNQAGLYTFQLESTKNQYESQLLTITVEIQIVPTTLSSNHNDDKITKPLISAPFDISVHFEDILNSLNISDATVSYSATGPENFADSGTMIHVGNGNYNISGIDPATDYGSIGTYSYQIIATKNQFETQYITITINIGIISTNLTSNHQNNEINVYWDEDFTLSINFLKYDDSTPISGATIAYVITGPSSYSSTGILDYISDGIYSQDFDTNVVYSIAGTYTFVISTNISGYESQQITISLTIETIPMNLSTSNTELTVFWEEDFTLSVNLVDGRNSNAITSALVSYSAAGTGSYSDTGTLTHDVGNPGTYRITFSTQTFNQAGIYTFSISATNQYHIEQSLTITININTRETAISTPSTEIGISYDDSFYLNITFTDVSYPASPTGISGATVSYSASGPNSYTRVGILTYNINGNYLIHFNASEDFPQEGTYNFLITATKNQYESQQVSITVNINIINTTLTATEDYINKIAGESFTLSVLYYNVTDGETPVNGATVSYTLLGYSGASLTEDGTTGNYSIQLNADDFGTGTFTFQITATKNQFETQQLLITVDIGLNAMNLTVSLIKDSTYVYWNDNFTLNATLVEGLDFVDEANVSYSVIDYPNINGTFMEGTNIYTIEFNSSSFPEAGSYSFEIEATKTNYGTRTKTIIVIIKIVPTNFTSLHVEDTINAHWEEDITIFVNLTDIQDTNNAINITDASVTYTAASLAAFSGPLTHSTGGLYYLSFNANDFGGAGSYTIKITAQKNQFETQQLTITVIVEILPTTLVNENSDSVGYWKDEVTFSYNFTETFTSTQITDGVIVYSVEQIPSLTGTLIHQTEGIYTVSLNTSQFLSAGTYTIHLEATKFQYQTQTKSLTLTISILPTNVSIIAENVVVYWEENFSLLVGYADTHNDINVTDAIVSSNLVGSTLYNNLLTYIGNGLYQLEYNTTQFPEAGNYTFQINFGKNQYESKQAWIYVQILILPTRISSENESIVIYWEDSFTLSVDYVDTHNNNRSISGATVAFLQSGESVYRTMNYQGDGTYTFVLQSDIDFTGAGPYEFLIEAKKDQYQTQIFWIDVEILIVPTNASSNHNNNKINKELVDSFQISINMEQIIEVLNPIGIPDATATFSVSGPEGYNAQGSLSHIGSGIYNSSIIQASAEYGGIKGTYVYQITITKNQYETQYLTITVNIAVTQTILTTNHQNDEINVYWDEDFVLNVTFSVLEDTVPITEGTISFTMTGPGSYTNSGSLTHMGSGVYEKPFDTDSVFTLAGTYTFYLTATRIDHETQQKSISLTISIIPTNLSSIVGSSVSLFWEESFTISANLTDGRDHTPITSALLQYTVTGTGDYSDVNILIHQTDVPGTYNLTFNSINFGQIGTYNFLVTSTKSHYVSHQFTVTVHILIRETDFMAEETDIDITYDESFLINTTYTDISHPTIPQGITGATISYTATGDNSYVMVGELTYITNGQYGFTFIADVVFPQEGTYSFQIVAEKANYETKQLTITVNVIVVSANLSASEELISKSWEENFTLSILYTNITTPGSPLGIEGATVSYTISGLPAYSGSLEDVGLGRYELELNTSDFTEFSDSGTYVFQITAEKNQFQTKQILISLEMDLKQMNVTITLVQNPTQIFWGDNFTLNADLKEEEGFVTGATVSYTVLDHPTIFGNFSEGGSLYSILLNSTIFPNVGSYTFEIEASNDGYGTRTKTFVVEIKIVPTELLSLHIDDTIEAYWNDPITMSFQFTDIQDELSTTFITGAKITYTATKLTPYTGNLTYQGDGIYSYSFNASDFGKSGTYSIQIRATKNQYLSQQLVLTVEVNILETSLETDVLNLDAFWLDEVNFTVSFQDVTNSEMITNGNITFSVSQVQGLNGTVTHMNSGIYSITLDTTQFLKAGEYTIVFEAKKFQYETQTLSFILDIVILPTAFTTDQYNINILWEENFTITTHYSDTEYDNNINDGEVKFTVGQVSGLLGNLTVEGNGNYNIELSSTQFLGVGTYSIFIQATKYQHQTRDILIYLTISRIDTTINQSIFLQSDVVMNVTTSNVFHFSYIDQYDRFIENATVAYYELQNGNTITSGTLEYLGNGIYELDLDLELKPVGTYLIVIHLGIENYYERAGSISLKIIKKQISLYLPETLIDKNIEQPEGEDIVIEFELFDPLANGPLTGATVYMVYRNQTFSLEEIDNSGTYRYIIDTSSAEYNAFFAAENDIATIFVEKANYTMPSFDIGISITPPEYNFGNVGIPKVFIIIGSAVGLLAIAVYGTTKYVKYLTIPLIVKQLASTRKAISGNKAIERIVITHTAEEEIYELFAKDWEMLDIDLKEVLEINEKASNELNNLTSEDMPQGGY
ncbi:hypothetical protein [Candidatus Lokiarchaeum ossiferum]|uniref:hypothetical protein n=1 Tax=Candidatus Lokiarchaeum ossiferum TaxID=2951803 RepID=UPI00352DAD06